MGAIFSAPKEPDLPPLPTEDEEAAAARRRRGVARTIRTSPAGVLTSAASSGHTSKTLLGE